MTISNLETQANPLPRYWSLNQIFAAAFLAGPLGGLYLMSKNFQTFGNPKSAKRTLYYGIASTIVLYLFAILFPVDRLPGALRPTIAAVIAISIQELARRLQKSQINTHKESGHKNHPFWKWFLYAFSLFLLEIILIFLVALVTTLVFDVT